jgi:hypothetical protein
MMRKTAVVFGLLLSLAVLSHTSSAQSDNAAEVSRPVHSDTMKIPLRDIPDRVPERPARGGRDFEPGRPFPVDKSGPVVDSALQTTYSPSSGTIEPKAAIDGVPIDPNYRVAPPDTTGDLGPNHYVQWVNLRYSVYDVARDASNNITGFALRSGFPKNGNVIWSGFGGQCETSNDGDPLVQYDQAADRWILTQFAVSSSPYLQCIAVSTGPDPTGTYNRYAYSFANDFNDFPKMGIWADKYVITYNMFRRGRTFSGANVCGYDRAAMIAGTTAKQVCVRTSTSYGSILPADVEGSTHPAAGSATPLLSITSSSLLAWRFSVNFAAGTATLNGPSTVAGVAAFSRACGGGTCVPQLGTTNKLDSLGDRLNYRLSYRQINGKEVMVVNHAVTAGSSTGIRWYEFRNASGQTLSSANPVVFQQGTYAPDSTYRWMGSAAMDSAGNIAVGYSASSGSIVPGIRFASRGPNDAAGTLGAESVIKAGGGSQNSTLARWGDYSTMSVDPLGGCNLVFTTEVLPATGNFNWATHIYSVRLPGCTN